MRFDIGTHDFLYTADSSVFVEHFKLRMFFLKITLQRLQGSIHTDFVPVFETICQRFLDTVYLYDSAIDPVTFHSKAKSPPENQNTRVGG